MQKEIKYTGFSETPSDYECPDGDLATVVGMVPEDEAMKPIQQPTTLFTLPEGYTVVFIHKNTGFRHFIVCHDDDGAKSYYWLADFEPQQVFTPEDFDEDNLIASFDDGREVYELNGIGNTLVILTSEGSQYYLWKGVDNVYNDLGNRFPELELSFGLSGSWSEGNAVTVITDSPFGPSGSGVRPDYTALYEAAAASVNTFISEKALKPGGFIFPFLVRAAYRLYDENLIMHTVPVFMAAGDLIEHHSSLHEDDNYKHTFRTMGPVFYLYYASHINNEELQKWKDIIKSVDIFITTPFYTYNQGGDYRFATMGASLGFMVPWSFARLYPYDSTHHRGFGNVTEEEEDRYFQKTDWLSFAPTGDAFYVPRFEKDVVIDNIKSEGNFYLFKSIPVESLETTLSRINVPERYLETLTQQELMTDDYESHDILIPRTSFVYNRRYHIANISKTLGNPASPIACASYTEYNLARYEIFVYIEQDNKMIVVKSDSTEINGRLEDGNPFIYFYYPNPNAKKVVIKKYTANNQVTVYEFPLTPHERLNGAVYFEGWEEEVTPSTEDPVPSVDRKVSIPNKLYTSEVANPFVFTPKGIQTVGVGTILGVRPIVKAMSLAQYGQHDLYVFSTDGVWSLEVDSEGYMQHPHLATPDIVLGAGESITQIDGAVLFATDRGIMLISGSDSICISEMLNSTTPFIPIGDTPADDLLPGLRNVVDTDMLTQMQIDNFRNFITDCRMTYDYPHQRIVIYSPKHSYAYVYSLKSKQWGMMPSKIQSTPLDYPAALAMVKGDDNKNVLVDYSKDDIVDGVIQVDSGLIITRPLKLDYPDVLKTVDTIIQRGKFQKGHVKSILYGSRDLQHWFLVWSSVDHYLRGFSGTPYKYFRLALLCNLEEGEGLMGSSVQFTPRLTDRLR